MASLFFSATTASNGTEPWRIDNGGDALQYANVSPGSGSSTSGGGGRFAEINGKYYMTAVEAGNVSHVYDITGATPVRLTNFTAHPTYSSGATGVFSFNGQPHFIYYPPAGGGSYNPPVLYAINAGAPSVVGNLTSNVGHSVYPGNFTELGGRLYYTAWTGSNPSFPYEFWSIGASGDGTKLTSVPSGFHLAESSSNYVVKFAGAIYFVGYTPDSGNELFKISAAGDISLVSDINTGTAGAFDTSYRFSPALTKEFNGSLYFGATTATSGFELYRIKPDGAVEFVADINTGGVGGSSSSQPFFYSTAVNGGELYFVATTDAQGSELWKIRADGTPVLAADVATGSANSNPTGLMAFNGSVYFSAETAEHGRELWRVGTSGTAERVTDLVNGSGSSNPTPVIVYNNALYFKATTAANGQELWRVLSNGTVEMVRDINPGTGDSLAAQFTLFDGKLWFSAYDPDHGTELWSIDTTGAATLHDINPGAPSSAPTSFTILGAGGNTAPTNIALSKATVREFGATDLAVGTLSATDAQGGAFTHALLNDAGGRFKIDGNVLEVNNGLLLDYEQAKTHTITVQVTDSDGLTFSKNFTISVTDINPETITGNSAANVFVGGAGKDVFKGLDGADILKGGAGNDKLYGGLGKDTLFGGANNDIFVFDTVSNTALNRDTIADFYAPQDSIMLYKGAFGAIGQVVAVGKTAPLQSKYFWASSTGVAHDNDDRIVYNTKTGVLSYDSNGKAAGGVQQIAVLTGHPSLTAADFILYA
ncbi:MAG: hypothetical protein LCH46_07550 [Proteobacteria bacterium]|nr:hypothetical protein [Pseudomonadota bacterium]